MARKTGEFTHKVDEKVDALEEGILVEVFVVIVKEYWGVIHWRESNGGDTMSTEEAGISGGREDGKFWFDILLLADS